MDGNLTQRRRGLEEKIPEIKKTLSMVEFLRDRRVHYHHPFTLMNHLTTGSPFLQEGKTASMAADGDDADDLEDDLEGENEGDEGGKSGPIRTTFELADTLYAEAELEETDTVFLWLGVLFLSCVVAPHPILIFALFIIYAGERYAVVQNTRSDRTAHVETRSGKHRSKQYDRRSGVHPRADDCDGGKHRACVQLGRQTKKG